MIALASAYSYAHLAVRFDAGSGAFTFLQRLHQQSFAASLAWLKILGYILTVLVYAFTFGHYLAHALPLGAWFPRLSELLVIVVFAWVNLRGVGESSIVEIITRVRG